MRFEYIASLPALLCGLILLAVGCPVAAADAPAPLVLERTIALPDVAGRIDHMAVDLRRQRLLVAELGNGSVDVIDIPGGRIVKRITGLREPQGVGYAAATDRIAIASAASGEVRLFRGEDLSPTGTVALGDDADNVRLDPGSGNFLVGFGSGGIATIDPSGRGTLARRTMLPAHPEGFQFDPASDRAFVNVPDAGQVAVVNLNTGAPVAAWRVPGLRANFPMALDQDRGVLATVFRNPPHLVLLDTGSGAIRTNLPTCGDADDVFFDARRQRIYVSCGAGSVDVFQKAETGYRPLARVATQSGARTALFVPELDRLFVARRAGLLGKDAALLVLRPQP